jgi:bifunctional non-homologous end joining protein LigD
VRYTVCNDRDTLLCLINLGSIDLHPWLSRRPDLDAPDWAVIDLDPSTDDFAPVLRVARELGRTLQGSGIPAFPKTSGAAGLHIFIPLVPGYSYEQTRMFCEALARTAVRDHPEWATVERAVARRGGRVYVDFLQNRRGQTVVPPYVVRPVPAASVSTPLEWDEVRGDLAPQLFTVETVPDRVRRLGDLFEAARREPIDLARAVDALAAFEEKRVRRP